MTQKKVEKPQTAVGAQITKTWLRPKMMKHKVAKTQNTVFIKK